MTRGLTRWFDPDREQVRSPDSRIRHDEDGFSLIELIVAMGIALLLLTIVPIVIQSVSDANSYSQGVTAGSTGLANAVQELEPRVQSASQICLPTQLTTAGPSVTSGYGMRVLSEAFGQTTWDQWWLNTSTHVLSVQQWPSNWVAGNSVPQWLPIAQSVVNSSTPPFSLPTVPTGSPQTLSLDLQAHGGYGNRLQTVEFKSSIAAFDTPYSSNPPVSCATAATQEGWT